MKVYLKTALLLFVFMVGVKNYASELNPSKTTRVESVSKKAFVLYANTEKESVSVKIKDMEGVLIYEEVLKRGYSYKKTYDISELPVGHYYVKVEDSISVKLFLVSGNEIKIVEDIDIKTLKKRKKVVAVMTD